MEAFGRIDILVNNAATNPAMGAVVDTDEKTYDHIIDTNLKGYFILSKLVGKIMRDQKGGNIINISSAGGVSPAEGLGPYCISKAGINMLTKQMAMELGPANIRVNAIAPRIVKTDFSKALWTNDKLMEREFRFTPLKCVATATGDRSVGPVSGLFGHQLHDRACDGVKRRRLLPRRRPSAQLARIGRRRLKGTATDWGGEGKPMDYQFTRQQQALREKTRAFVQREIPEEKAVAVETADVFPHDLMAKLAAEGFFGINVPEIYGGQGGTVIEEMIFFEEISKALPVLAWTAGDVILYGNNIIKTNGNDAQKQAYLPRLVRGEMLFCFALTEPDAGSDAASIQTAAEPVNGNWVITGNKMFISGASVADIAVTNTRTAPSKYGGITAFLVDTRSQGYQAVPIKKLGYKGSDTCEVVYDAVTVSEDQILGGAACLNQGWPQMMRLLNGERLVLSACALGIAERVLSHLVPFVQQRAAAARPAGRYQDVEHKVVELATEVEAARRLADYAAWMVTEKKAVRSGNLDDQILLRRDRQKSRGGGHADHGQPGLGGGLQRATVLSRCSDPVGGWRHQPDSEEYHRQKPWASRGRKTIWNLMSRKRTDWFGEPSATGSQRSVPGRKSKNGTPPTVSLRPWERSCPNSGSVP